jgi:hypothetical protein
VGGISVGFCSIYLIDRKHWWALIPGGILGVIAFFLLLATATGVVCPAALILLGLLMLRGSLGGGRRRAVREPSELGPVPSIDMREIDQAVETSEPERERLPTLEEQIEAAIAEESDEAVIEKGEAEDTGGEALDTDEAEPSADVPAPPEMPEAPEVPEPPEM